MKAKYVCLIAFLAASIYMPAKVLYCGNPRVQHHASFTKQTVRPVETTYSVSGSIVNGALPELSPLADFGSKPKLSGECKLGVLASYLKQNPYRDLILRVSRKYRVDQNLVAAVMRTESNFNPKAKSPVGAMGLMQLMPETAAMYKVKKKELFNPSRNVEAGVQHLKRLVIRYPNRQDLVIAAYNAGQGNVDRYNGIPPFTETQNYVTKVQYFYNAM